MKKYLLLFILTVLGVKLSLMTPELLEFTSHKTQLVSAVRQDVINSVTATGKIENTQNLEVNNELPLVPDIINHSIGDHVKKGDILFTVNKKETAKQLAILNIGSSNALNQYNLNNTGLIEDQIPEYVKSPSKGVVNSINVEKGKLSNPQKPLFTISSGNGLQVRATVSENFISSVAVGQSVKIEGNGFKNTTYEGTIISLADEAKEVLEGTIRETIVECIISINNPDDKLKPGYTAKATIITDAVDNALIIPYEALAQDNENRKYVYKVKNGWAIKTIISTGDETPDGIVVKRGIKDGEELAVNPQTLNGEYIRVAIEE